MWTSSTSNGPSSSVLAVLDVARPRPRAGGARRAWSAPSPSSAGRRRPADVASAQLAQDPRQRAEVVLVAVGDDDALDVVDALAQVGEVRQHEVDADHLGGREAQADVDDDDRGPRTRRPSCSCRSRPARRAGGRAASSSRCGVRGLQEAVALERAADRRPCSASSASTSGRRRPPTRWPSMFSAALTRDRVRRSTPSASKTSRSAASIAARSSGSSTMRRISVADDVAGDEDAAGAADVERPRRGCRRCRRRRRGRRRARGSSLLACLTPSMCSICASSASRSFGMSSAVRGGML